MPVHPQLNFRTDAVKGADDSLNRVASLTMHLSFDLFHQINFAIARTLVLAQGEVPAGGEGQPVQPAPEGFMGVMQSLFQNPLNVLAMAAMLFFVIVLLPQQRQMKAEQKALAKALSEMKKNDRVITASGIHGVVIQSNTEEGTVTIRIDENSGARMKINRDVIVKVIADK